MAPNRPIGYNLFIGRDKLVCGTAFRSVLCGHDFKHVIFLPRGGFLAPKRNFGKGEAGRQSAGWPQGIQCQISPGFPEENKTTFRRRKRE
jgi:hypothetical protein